MNSSMIPLFDQLDLPAFYDLKICHPESWCVISNEDVKERIKCLDKDG
jgi:aminopeptidase N